MVEEYSRTILTKEAYNSVASLIDAVAHVVPRSRFSGSIASIKKLARRDNQIGMEFDDIGSVGLRRYWDDRIDEDCNRIVYWFNTVDRIISAGKKGDYLGGYNLEYFEDLKQNATATFRDCFYRDEQFRNSVLARAVEGRANLKGLVSEALK
jgi:hypothetical protein